MSFNPYLLAGFPAHCAYAVKISFKFSATVKVIAISKNCISHFNC